MILKFKKEEFKRLSTVDGKEVLEIAKNDKGEIIWRNNDLYGLHLLLNAFDSRQHYNHIGYAVEWKNFLSLRDKLYTANLENADSIDLSNSESEFLQSYLENLPEKEYKDRNLGEFEMRCRDNLLTQFEKPIAKNKKV